MPTESQDPVVGELPTNNAPNEGLTPKSASIELSHADVMIFPPAQPVRDVGYAAKAVVAISPNITEIVMIIFLIRNLLLTYPTFSVRLFPH